VVPDRLLGPPQGPNEFRRAPPERRCGEFADEILIELLLVVKLSKVRQISSPSETEAPYKPVLVTVAKVNFGVSADESLVKDFDAAIGQIPRSRAIADLMVDFLERHGFRSPEPKEATS